MVAVVTHPSTHRSINPSNHPCCDACHHHHTPLSLPHPPNPSLYPLQLTDRRLAGLAQASDWEGGPDGVAMSLPLRAAFEGSWSAALRGDATAFFGLPATGGAGGGRGKQGRTKEEREKKGTRELREEEKEKEEEEEEEEEEQKGYRRTRTKRRSW